MSSDRKTHKTGPPERPPLDARDALLGAGRRVFARKGFEGATVKDLAEEAGVNISLVSYHFGGKEGLYRTCLESFGLERVEATERILRAPTSHEEFRLRLQLFAEDFIEIHQKNADTCKMIHRAMEAVDPIAADIFKQVFQRMFTALQSFVKAAQKIGIVRGELDVEISTFLMFGSLVHILRSQEIARLMGKRTLDDTHYRAQVVTHWVNNATSGIFAPHTGSNRRDGQ